MWVAAIVLMLYGTVLTAIGVAVESSWSATARTPT